MSEKSLNNCLTCDLRDLDVCTKVPGVATGIINSTSIKQVIKSWEGVNFNSNRIIKGSAISHIPPSPDFVIFLEGIYQIIFTSNISHTSSNNEILSSAIAINNGIILSTNVRNNIRQNEIKSIMTQTIVNIPKDVPINIKIINTGTVETIYTNPNITITKL